MAKTKSVPFILLVRDQPVYAFEIKENAVEQHKIKTYKIAKRGIPLVRPEFDEKAKTIHHQLQQVRGSFR